jgi:hypothetical protein
LDILGYLARIKGLQSGEGEAFGLGDEFGAGCQQLA